MNNFADKLQKSIERSKSFLVCGIDPQLESIPECLLVSAKACSDSAEAIYQALTTFGRSLILALKDSVAAVKPNIAFFEQYGLSGLRAFHDVCSVAREHSLPVIIDAKVGDIGNTAAAYSRAFIGRAKIFGKEVSAFDGDAVTVNPFLGFDTVEPFLETCKEHGKGIFVLVRTSNPGSGAIQGLRDTSNRSGFDVIAEWLSKQGEALTGSCGYSSVGAVVGATYPEEAKAIRAILSKGFFLIPGLGAQGGSATDAVSGFAFNRKNPQSSMLNPGGAVINVSRGFVPKSASSIDDFIVSVKNLAKDFNQQVTDAVTTLAVSKKS